MLKLRMSRRASVILFVGLLSGVGVFAQAKTQTVTLLQMNDVYSVNGTDKGARGGLARVATLLDKIRAENPNTHLILAGDFLFPSADSILFRGAQMIAALNAIPVDLVTLGNHEFDGGEAILKARMAESKFPWVSSNVVSGPKGLPGVQAIRLENWGGVKVGVFGLLTEEVKTVQAFASRIVSPPVNAAKKAVAELKRRGAQVIIGVTHLSLEEDQQIAAKVPGITVILGGHEHTVLQSVVGKTLILKAGSEARDLGRIDIAMNNGRVEHVDFGLIPVVNEVAKAPRVVAALKTFEEQANTELAKPVAETRIAIDASNANRVQSTAFGNWLADRVRVAAGGDIGLVNGGNIRAEQVYKPGMLVRRDLFNMLPFPNTIAMRELSGADLKTAMERSVSALPVGKGYFLQISGFTADINPALPAGKRVQKLTWAAGAKYSGEILPDQKFLAAMPDFIAEGGDGYDVFRRSRVALPAMGEGMLLLDLMISEAEKAAVWEIPVQIEERVRYVHAP